MLIGYMGGRCIEVLAEKVTHLVTESVRTKKYDVNKQLDCIFNLFFFGLFQLIWS